MSIITVIARRQVSATGLFKLHKLLGIPLSDIKSRIDSVVPVFDEEIFVANYDEKSKVLREIVRVAQSEGINLSIFETPTSLQSEGYKKSGAAISRSTLLNILNSADEDVERF